METNEIIILWYTKFELLYIFAILLSILYFYTNLKFSKKFETKWYTLDELIEQSKKALNINELTEKDINYLKSLWNPETQTKWQKVIVELKNRNAIIALSILIPWFIFILLLIEYLKIKGISWTIRENYVAYTSFSLCFIISTPIAINWLMKIKELPKYARKSGIFNALGLSILCLIVIYLFAIWHFKI